MRSVRVRGSDAGLAQEVTIGSHVLRADEPVDKGGADSGPEPHELLLAALGACTAMTLRLYAARKGWALADVDVHLTGRHDGERFVIDRRLRFGGTLDADERARLVEIATKCPVHRTLSGTITIETREQADYDT